MICTMKFIRKERADMEYQNPSYLRRPRAAWLNVKLNEMCMGLKINE